MSEASPTGALPTGVELDHAIAQAKAGHLPPTEFAAALADATLMLAVVSRAGDDAVAPFVIDVDGTDYGAAFTSPRQFDQFSAQTPFVLMAGRDLDGSWPAGLGLAINPGAVPSMLLNPAQLRAVVAPAPAAPDGGPPPSAAPGTRAGDTTVRAGTPFRLGAPDPGLPAEALDLLRRLAQSDADVLAAYQLALAFGDEPIQLAVGIEAAEPGARVAQRFAERVMDADAGFRGLAFVDLDGELLRSARRYSPPLG